MKPIVLIDPVELRQQYHAYIALHPEAKNLEYQKRGLSSGHDLVFINEDDFCVEQVEGHIKKFYVCSNHLDPEHPVSPQEAAANLAEALVTGTLEENPDDPDWPMLKLATDGQPEIENYHGKYVDSLEEAIAWVAECRSKPVKEWDKEYNKPIKPVENN